MLSLQENTADRSPPVFAPDGTAMTSASRPANSRERCALSLPAQSSMQPKGRAADVVHARVSGEIFLSGILVFSAHLLVDERGFEPPASSLRTVRGKR